MEDGKPPIMQPHTPGTAAKTIEDAKPLHSNDYENLC